MMSLISGAKLGPYEIQGALGAGGMGEVYRARDTRLDRTVAIKILPAHLSSDATLRQRFEREAKTISGLNHSNICVLHDVGHQDGMDYLVMECVEGETLAKRLERGPLPLKEALKYAIQIAEALEAAHDRGIIHRDLKPANVKITPEGKIKVLDFGLAKALAEESRQVDLSQSPTITGPSTRADVMLGTAAYMSPEQARGKPLDKRTDIWSFGCVLYEALTGRQAFAGETVSDIIASVLHDEPDWSKLPAEMPANLQSLLRRCLQKDPDRRLHDIADARIEIDELLASPSGSLPSAERRRGVAIWQIAAVVVLTALLAAAASWLIVRQGNSQETSTITQVARLTHEPGISEWPTWSPDGSLLAYASNRTGNLEIFVRRVEGGHEVNVTNNSSQNFQPAFSPDGNYIAFVSTRSSRTGMIKIGGNFPAVDFRTYGGDVWLVPALGGQARRLAAEGNFPIWHPKDRKVAYVSGTENHRSVLEISPEGGTPHPVLSSDASSWEITRIRYSPNGRWITFEDYNMQVFIMPSSGGQPRKLVDGLSHVWEPSGKHLYYCTRDTLGGTRLESVAINESTGEVRTAPVTLGLMTGILSDPAFSPDGERLAVKEWDGSLNLTRLPLSRTGGSPAGPEEILSEGQVADHMPSVSPDGDKIAYGSNRLGHNQVWIANVKSKRLEPLQLPGNDLAAQGVSWHPDGKRLTVLRQFPGGKLSLWLVAADGSYAEELLTREFLLAGESWPVSPDGKREFYAAKVKDWYQLFDLDLTSHKARQLTSSPGDKYHGEWSPDGTWIAYVSNASGALQVWRMPADGGQAEQLTKGEDRIRHFFYSRDGRWLYFQPNHQNIYRMPATGGPTEQVTHFPESGLFLEEPAISSDGRYLVYCRSNGGSSLWLLRLGNSQQRVQ